MRNTTLEYVFFLALVLAATAAFGMLIQDFLQPLFWAAILAILFHPSYRYGMRILGPRPSLVASLTLVMIVLSVIVPFALLGFAVTREAAELYTRIAAGKIDVQAPLRFLHDSLPAVTAYLDRFGVDAPRLQQGISNVAVTVSQWLASQAFNIGQDALHFGVMFCFMLYLLFFFLRDGTRIVGALMRVLPIGDEREQRLFIRFAEVSRAAIKGTLVIALVQGAFGGLIFWLLGINAAVLWGAVMALLSLLPTLGSALIWGPAALIFIANGAYVKGLLLLGVGSLVIGLVDNLLRPLLVGRDIHMPDYVVLLATLGGLTVVGMSGLVIGPIIAALSLTVWEMFEQEHKHENIRGTVDDEVKTVVKE